MDHTGPRRLEVGFAAVDITPDVRADTPVWLAGYYPGRAATGVHDPLYARCVVLRDGREAGLDLGGPDWTAVA